jgi:hypothetical protein
MTTYAENDRRPATASWPLYAALGAGTAFVLTALGTFWDLTGNDTRDGDALTEYLQVAVVIVVATAVVFGLVVRTAPPATAGRRAVVLAVLGFLTLVAFWSGLPPVLASGAVALALKVPGMPTTAKVALGLSVVTLVLAVALAVAG